MGRSGGIRYCNLLFGNSQKVENRLSLKNQYDIGS